MDSSQISPLIPGQTSSLSRDTLNSNLSVTKLAADGVKFNYIRNWQKNPTGERAVSAQCLLRIQSTRSQQRWHHSVTLVLQFSGKIKLWAGTAKCLSFGPELSIEYFLHQLWIEFPITNFPIFTPFWNQIGLMVSNRLIKLINHQFLPHCNIGNGQSWRRRRRRRPSR